MDVPQATGPAVTLPRQRGPDGPLPRSRIFVASPAGTVAAWVMPACATAPVVPVQPGPARTTAWVPPPRSTTRWRRQPPLVPPGRHMRSTLAVSWPLARDVLLALLAVAVLVLAVVAVQQPT